MSSNHPEALPAENVEKRRNKRAEAVPAGVKRLLG